MRHMYMTIWLWPWLCVCLTVYLWSGFTRSEPTNVVSAASISQPAFWLRACQLNTWTDPNWAWSLNCSALIIETLSNTTSVFKEFRFWKNLTRCCIYKSLFLFGIIWRRAYEKQLCVQTARCGRAILLMRNAFFIHKCQSESFYKPGQSHYCA